MMIRLATLWLLSVALCAVELRLVAPAEPRVGDLVEWEVVGVAPPASHRVGDPAMPRLEVAVADGPENQRDRIVIRHAFHHRPFRSGDDDEPFVAEFVPTGPVSLRVRHCFRRSGAHELALTHRRGEVLWRGRVDVAPAEGPTGTVGLSPHNPNLLARSDGTPVVPIGCNVAWGTRPDRAADLIRHIDALADHGGDHVRVWCASWCGQVDGAAEGRIRLEQAWLLDRVLAAARERGVFVTLVLDNHHDLTHGKAFPYGDTARERVATFFDPALPQRYRDRIRYLTARFGADDTILAWEVFNEIDLALLDHTFSHELEDPADMAERWAAAAGDFIQAHDPDHHLVTISLSRETWPGLFAQGAVDLVQVHRYVPSYGLLSPVHHDAVELLDEAIDPFRHMGKPWLASEVGHHGTEEINPGNRVDQGGIVLRQQAWAGLLLGGYGSGMNWWWDTHLHHHDLWPVYAPLAEVVAAVDWRDGLLQPMQPNHGSSLRILGWRSPDQAVLWPQIRRDTWHRLAVTGAGRSHYGERGPRIRITGMRPDTAFRIRAFDMIAGGTVWTREATSDEDGRLPVDLAADCGRQVLVVDRAP